MSKRVRKKGPEGLPWQLNKEDGENSCDWAMRKADHERWFKSFIFAELDRRRMAETDAMAAEVQAPENERIFLEMVAEGWTPPPPPKRGRGRPANPVARLLVPSEDAARTADMVRDIFWDYWGRRNRPYHPTAEEIAAEYVGIKLGRVKARKKHGARRPAFKARKRRGALPPA